MVLGIAIGILIMKLIDWMFDPPKHKCLPEVLQMEIEPCGHPGHFTCIPPRPIEPGVRYERITAFIKRPTP